MARSKNASIIHQSAFTIQNRLYHLSLPFHLPTPDPKFRLTEPGHFEHHNLTSGPPFRSDRYRA